MEWTIPAYAGLSVSVSDEGNIVIRNMDSADLVIVQPDDLLKLIGFLHEARDHLAEVNTTDEDWGRIALAGPIPSW